MFPSRFPFARAALGGALLLALAACGGAGKDTQVAVRVNKGEISVHQVQLQMQRIPPSAMQDPAQQATGRALEQLVDQELAAQAAVDAGLDKDPKVIQTIEAARREILARSYQERVAARVVGPGSDEVDRFYEQRSELFAKRRLYVLRETVVDSAADAATVQGVVERARSIEELDKGLREAGLRNNARLLTSAAEDLPSVVLGRIASLEPGQSALVAVPGALRIFTVAQATRAPVDRESAGNLITAYLTNERRAAAVGEAIKKLRSEGRIEYVGNFAQTSPGAASAPAAKASQ